MSNHLFMTEVVQPVLIKAGEIFLAAAPDGTVSGDGEDGSGLYFHDTRYLSRYQLTIGGHAPMTLMASSAAGDEAAIQLSNYEIVGGDAPPLPLQALHIDLRRKLDNASRALTDSLQVRSFAAGEVNVRLALTFDAAFEDLFQQRGAAPGARGRVDRTVGAGRLDFAYHGADGVERRLEVSFSPPPTRLGVEGSDPAVAIYDLCLSQQAIANIRVDFRVAEDGPPSRSESSAAHASRPIAFASDDGRLDAAMAASFRDLRLLNTRLDHDFIAGGLPWFAAPFARDSIIAALQLIAYDPAPAEGVARQLAGGQGRAYDAKTFEEPGKIPHELRVGEMARLHEIPHRPSYFSIDATPLFIVLAARHAAVTASLDLVTGLSDEIEAALGWIDGRMAADPRGYLSYDDVNDDGLVNQGWKDSGTAIVHPDGRLATGPVSLCEVQAYVYLAKTELAAVLENGGDAATASRLRTEAQALRERFNDDFWMEDEGCFCLALEKDGVQVRSIASNAGHALWAGIADPTRARRTADRLLRADMSSGWGVRTLSDAAISYNPLHYHLGSVWPFDNALLVEGLLAYGLRTEASALFSDILDAAGHFSLWRLPEFYVGFRREADLFPARCPFAEPLQAWSAGALPGMVAAFLGLAGQRSRSDLAEAPPILPPGVSRVALTQYGSDAQARDLTFGSAPSQATEDGASPPGVVRNARIRSPGP
ncbi:amylo-alpha-1,6-glucosidase [Brevundimonas sp.]|uniref:amylo-alpha-1,6-glucosidase n=1 Tax=Brevundimonas sp. TaxID=1871086 RepID=UPI003F71D334